MCSHAQIPSRPVYTCGHCIPAIKGETVSTTRVSDDEPICIFTAEFLRLAWQLGAAHVHRLLDPESVLRSTRPITLHLVPSPLEMARVVDREVPITKVRWVEEGLQ